jgi:hypothetical protein
MDFLPAWNRADTRQRIQALQQLLKKSSQKAGGGQQQHQLDPVEVHQQIRKGQQLLKHLSLLALPLQQTEQVQKNKKQLEAVLTNLKIAFPSPPKKQQHKQYTSLSPLSSPTLSSHVARSDPFPMSPFKLGDVLLSPPPPSSPLVASVAAPTQRRQQQRQHQPTPTTTPVMKGHRIGTRANPHVTKPPTLPKDEDHQDALKQWVKKQLKLPK